jgi:hypothetical protein
MPTNRDGGGANQRPGPVTPPADPNGAWDGTAGLGLEVMYDSDRMIFESRLQKALDALGAQGGYGGGRGGGGGVSKAQRKANLLAQLQDRVKQLGLTFTDTELETLASDAVKNNWDDTVITDKLLVSVNWANVTGGDLTAGSEMLRGLGREYMVAVSPQQANDWSLRIAKGELTQAGVESMMRQQATARYSWMKPLIDTGIKPGDYFAPIQNMIAQTLEVAPDTVDLLDPKWMDMVEVKDSNGSTRAATLNEAMLKARSRPEWAKTRQAQDSMANMATNLASIFGRAE